MTEQVDLDAIELRAMRFQKLNPLHECFDSTTVLALIAELRQERERVSVWKSRRNEALDEEARLRTELEQERGRADDLLTANVGLVDAVYATDAALSRAEETIEKVRTALRRAMSRKEWRDRGWEVPAIEVKCALDAIEYGKQKDQTA